MHPRDLLARNPAPLRRVPRIAAQGVVVLHDNFEMATQAQPLRSPRAADLETQVRATSCALLGQPSEYFPKMLPQFLVQNLPAPFRHENYMIFALPLRMV
jgi:hypothetical protein